MVFIKVNAIGNVNKYLEYWWLVFSYDGDAFRHHADSKNEHYEISMANFEDSPLAVGGYSPNTNKAETYDISTNIWTEVADYPYHDS